MIGYSEICKDWLNRSGLRNADNTDIDLYNCGGYALGTYSWYMPYPENFDREDSSPLPTREA